MKLNTNVKGFNICKEKRYAEKTCRRVWSALADVQWTQGVTTYSTVYTVHMLPFNIPCHKGTVQLCISLAAHSMTLAITFILIRKEQKTKSIRKSKFVSTGDKYRDDINVDFRTPIQENDCGYDMVLAFHSHFIICPS